MAEYNFTVGWFGFGGGSWQADMLRDEFHNHSIRLLTSHEYANADVKYSHTRMGEFFQRCDCIILPSRLARQSAKGVNRLAIAWSFAKPCVVAPLDSYMEYVEDGKNALVANSPTEMVEKVVWMRDNPDQARLMGQVGLNTAHDFLQPLVVFNDFLEQFKQVQHVQPAHKVAVIIPHYSDRKDFLIDCVNSVIKTRGPQRKIYVVTSSKVPIDRSKFKENTFQSEVHVLQSEYRLTFSQANNLALKRLDPDVTHVLLLNDDTLMNEVTLERMMESIGDKEMILNPWSNCDQGWLHHDFFAVGPLKQLNLHPGMSYESVLNKQVIENYKIPRSRPLIDAPFCAMYATLIPVSVIKKVGLLDEDFKNGGEDADYSYRARELGIPCKWTRNAFVFHYGGQTRKFAEGLDRSAHHEEDRLNNELLRNKWGKSGKKTICIYTGPSWEVWGPQSMTKGGIGGSETCAIRLAQEYSNAGHKVIMVGEHVDQVQDGITWSNYQKWNNSEYFDVLISSRNSVITKSIKAKKKYVWIHDIFILDQRHGEIPQDVIEGIDSFIVLCPWHKQFVMDFHKIPEDKIMIIPNGINTELF